MLNRNSDKLAVIFPGWHTHNFPVNILAGRLVKQGWAVLVFDFHDQIMIPDEDTVVDRFVMTKYQKRLAEKLKENKADIRIKKYRTGHILSIIRFCLFGNPIW